MAASTLKLPGPYAEGKSYLMSGKTLNEIMVALQADRVIPGKGQTESQTPQGRVIFGGIAGGDSGTCQLGGFTGSDITPGYIIGGGASQLIEPGAIAAAANKNVWLKCPWTAQKVDEVLQAGGTMGTVLVQSGANVPDDIPTIASLTGTAYIPLGGWDSDSNWVSAGCGTITLDFCPGGFLKSR